MSISLFCIWEHRKFIRLPLILLVIHVSCNFWIPLLLHIKILFQVKKKIISSWSWHLFLTGYHQIWWQRNQQVSIFSQGWGSGWWPHQGHCLRPGSGEDRRHSNQENLLRGLHKEWVYLLFGFLSLFFFNKNKVLVKDFKDHCSENMSCYAILRLIHQVSWLYFLCEFSIRKIMPVKGS